MLTNGAEGPDIGALEQESGDKTNHFSAEDGLDQEIQRAIAQHDLEQQQLQDESARGQASVPEHESNQGGQNVGIHEQTPAHSESNAHSRSASPAVQVEAGKDAAIDDAQMDGSHMDAAGEKIQLQMIADELQRATSGSADPSVKLEDASVPEKDHGSEPVASQPGTAARNEYNREANGHDDGSIRDTADELDGVSQRGPRDASTSSDALLPHASDTGEKDTSHSGYIPADSELLATNTALAAYNALSSHVPPTASLASVHLAALPLPIIAPDYLPARIQLLISTLPVLDNLATQLLRVFAAGPYQKIIDLASNSDTAPGAAFRDLTSLFEFTKRLYSEEDPFLSVEHLAPGIWKEGDRTPSMFCSREQTIESTLRKVNLATFLAATLGTIEVGFFHLNESFLSVFCPANNLDPANSMSNMSSTNMSLQSGVNTVIGDKVGKVLKPQASLYLDLKTQAYISAVEAGERSREEILEDILPSNIEEVLLERRGIKTLSPTEVDFVSRCRSRKETLLNYPPGGSLNEEYEWFAFLKDLFDFVSKNMSFLIWGKRTKPTSLRSERTLVEVSMTPHSDELLKDTSGTSRHTHDRIRSRPESADLNEPASSQEISEITSALLPSEIQEQQIHIRINPRMGGKGSSRRPWTREEEKALRHALELKGPQWSTILELFGQGGRINEALKNRTQVQLKDKARNWKMFFLKSGLPVPAYLQKVTGDLERDDKVRAKNARNRKTAAAPVPVVTKRDNNPHEDNTGEDASNAKKQKI